MSSALLYLAIIAIWACVLVPRWIHKPDRVSQHAAPQESADRQHTAPGARGGLGVRGAGGPGTAHAVTFAEHGAGEDDEVTLEHEVVTRRAVVFEDDEVAEYDEVTEREIFVDEDGSGEGIRWSQLIQRHILRTPAAGASPGSYHGPGMSRARILQARRRLLTMLVTLMIVTIVFTGARLSPPWVLIPTGGMLGMYLLLLREAAHADTERAQRRAEEHAAQAEAAREQARLAFEAQQAEPTAQIIDISARVKDQLYDQYSDAAARAVGD